MNGEESLSPEEQTEIWIKSVEKRFNQIPIDLDLLEKKLHQYVIDTLRMVKGSLMKMIETKMNEAIEKVKGASYGKPVHYHYKGKSKGKTNSKALQRGKESDNSKSKGKRITGERDKSSLDKSETSVLPAGSSDKDSGDVRI